MKTPVHFLLLLLFFYGQTTAADAQCPAAILAAENMTVMVSNGRYSVGAGIIMALQGQNIYIATAKHVVNTGPAGRTSITVEFKSEEEEKISAQSSRAPVFSKDKDLDLAFLVVENRELADRLRRQSLWQILRSRSAPKLSTGPARAIIIGQGGEQGWARPSEPEPIVREKGNLIEIQSSVVEPGFSGGGVFDPGGLLIGIVTADSGKLAQAMTIEPVLEEARRLRLPVDLRETERTPAPFFIAPLSGAPEDWDKRVKDAIRDKLEQQLAAKRVRLLECESPSRAISLFGAVQKSQSTLTTDVAIVTWRFNHLNGLTTTPQPQHVQFYRLLGSLSEHADDVAEYAVTSLMKEFSQFDIQPPR